MPTNKQRRQAAQRHLQRQLERRAELARRRRRNLGIGRHGRRRRRRRCRVLLLTGVVQRRRRHRRPPRAAAPSAPTGSAAATTNPDGTVTCTYSPGHVGQHEPQGRRHAARTRRRRRPRAPTTLKMSTNQGDLTLTLDRTKAPCAAASFTYLALEEVLRQQPVPPRGQPADLRRPAVRRPDRHRLGRPDLHVRRGGHRGDDVPARHDRDGQQRPARTRPAASSSSASPTPSSARTTPPSAPSTRPASPCWTRSPRPATTARSSPARRRRARSCR